MANTTYKKLLSEFNKAIDRRANDLAALKKNLHDAEIKAAEAAAKVNDTAAGEDMAAFREAKKAEAEANYDVEFINSRIDTLTNKPLFGTSAETEKKIREIWAEQHRIEKDAIIKILALLTDIEKLASDAKKEIEEGNTNFAEVLRGSGLNMGEYQSALLEGIYNTAESYKNNTLVQEIVK